MLKLKKVVILFVVLLLVWSIGSQVQATNLTLDLTNFATTGNATADTNTATTNETANAATNGETTQIVQPTTNSTNRTGSAENDLPQTGVTEDITVMFFIVVCVIAAIYAYKKITDYRS